jgi:hypothetical protein
METKMQAVDSAKVKFLEEFIRGYIVCAIWSAPEDDDGNNLDSYDSSDLAESAIADIRADCEDFVLGNWETLLQYAEKMETEEYTGAEMAGHDFSLTRNGHGAGFWDRGLGDIGRKLTETAKIYGSSDIYIGDDGKLYVA